MNVKEDMLKKKKEINEKTEIFIFVFLAFILLTTWAMTQPCTIVCTKDWHRSSLWFDYTCTI